MKPTKWKQYLRLSENLLVAVTGAALLTTVISQFEFNFFEASLYDLRIRRGAQPAADQNIVLITLDDATTRALNDFAPLTLDVHTQLLEALEKAEPKAIGYLVDLNRVAENNPDLFNGDWATRFTAASDRLQKAGIPFMIGTSFDVTGEVLPPYPLSNAPHSVAVIHRDGNVFAEDKVTRRALTYLYERPVFHLELAAKAGLLPERAHPRGEFYVPEVDANYFFFRYHGSTAVGSGPSPYPHYSVIEIMEGRVPPEALKGKILLVGSVGKEDSGDFVFTPFSKEPFANPKLLVHANILDSVIHDQGVIRVHSSIDWAIAFIMTAFIIFFVLSSKPLYGVFAMISMGTILFGLAQGLFAWESIWIKLSQPLVGIFLGYYFVVPFRLIREYKQRWDYQRKNELLIQVEELKTNFMSLVTHDLKTPVARIQGLAEVLLRTAVDRLVERDQETVRTIIASTEELNHFISSILELSKIESHSLTIQKQSKDLNQLVERSLELATPQAKARSITLRSELEPLFPIKLDPNLVSKVINNIIDNAVKYSESGSEVLVRTQEVDGMVELSVTDHGIGMSEDELDQLFTRFYRAKNDTTTKITGTGLGLYLTKYFVEAHGGEVKVESEMGHGSTFRIRLPIHDQSLQSGLQVKLKDQSKSPQQGVEDVSSTRS